MSSIYVLSLQIPRLPRSVTSSVSRLQAFFCVHLSPSHGVPLSPVSLSIPDSHGQPSTRFVPSSRNSP